LVDWLGCCHADADIFAADGLPLRFDCAGIPASMPASDEYFLFRGRLLSIDFFSMLIGRQLAAGCLTPSD